jgi:hypothetical protein
MKMRIHSMLNGLIGKINMRENSPESNYKSRVLTKTNTEHRILRYSRPHTLPNQNHLPQMIITVLNHRINIPLIGSVFLIRKDLM